MTDEVKAIRERKVFGCFLTQHGWPDDMDLFESRKEPEPDILYRHPQEGTIAFELTEICSPEIAQEISNLSAGDDPRYIRTGNPTRDVLSNKFSKKYETKHPIELLCYNAGRVVAPDDLIIADMMPIIECREVNFQRIWLFGDKIHCLYFNQKN